MCKYSEMLIDPYRVRYAIEKAIYLARPVAPVPVGWIFRWMYKAAPLKPRIYWALMFPILKMEETAGKREKWRISIRSLQQRVGSFLCR